jgi:putative oxygen-independent coproporphyrinogen III oxidase
VASGSDAAVTEAAMPEASATEATLAQSAGPAAPLPPLSLYVHFPWCVRKCPYCDFNSHALHGELPEDSYVAALLQDLSLQAPRLQGRELRSIFLGGGTPSLFSPQSLARLLQGCAQALPLAWDAEITLEANPGTTERGRFAGYRAAGVNRVSLGAQSFSDAQLCRLGRIHAAADTRRAVAELRAAGLTNFNLDLMFGLPEQSLAEARADIDAALALEPPHLSHYQLTLEPGTLFGARPPAGLPDADVCADMQRLCQERLAEAGLQRYEVSGYAHPAARCLHNLNYWQFGDYIGIGAGAHGKCTRVAEVGIGGPSPSAEGAARQDMQGTRLLIERTARPREPRRYLAAAAASATDAPRAVTAEELPFEFLMNALRLVDGFEAACFERRTGLAIEMLAPRLSRLVARGLMEQAGDRWRASSRGLDLLNELLIEFLPPEPRERRERSSV